MNTLVTRPSRACAPERAMSRRFAVRPTPAVSDLSAPVAGRGWIERLADWAERQPAHRRVGSWILYR